jgi:ABC-type Fe3+/spermidine/putrescine transport system ATPase subunit
MADTIAVMNQGKIEQLGSPSELYERPKTAFVANFLGTSNLLDGTVESQGTVRLDDGTLVSVDTADASGPISVGVRPEKVTIGGEHPNSLAGRVKESAYIGVATHVVVTTAVGDVSVFHQNSEAGGLVPAPGENVKVSWRADSGFVVKRGETPT